VKETAKREKKELDDAIKETEKKVGCHRCRRRRLTAVLLLLLLLLLLMIILTHLLFVLPEGGQESRGAGNGCQESCG
jgi:hypothetical protein